ncbi:MAG: hypothetical protein AABX71_02430 [Nanoarchaeota archaeon]
MKIKEGDVVLCTVSRISGTSVFVNIEDNRERLEGSIVTSEIAPGRIRNLRDYVVPNKKIVCKVLRIERNHIDLSLRRVMAKDRKEVLEKYERERTAFSILKSVVKEKAEEITEKIKQTSSLDEFLQACRENPAGLKKYFTEEQAEKICKILAERKDRQVEVKKEFSLSSKETDGIKIIKNILLPYKEKITYISAGRFVIKIKAEAYKPANQEVQKILEDIEDKARKKKAEFKVKEK